MAALAVQLEAAARAAEAALAGQAAAAPAEEQEAARLAAEVAALAAEAAVVAEQAAAVPPAQRLVDAPAAAGAAAAYALPEAAAVPDLDMGEAEAPAAEVPPMEPAAKAQLRQIVQEETAVGGVAEVGPGQAGRCWARGLLCMQPPSGFNYAS